MDKTSYRVLTLTVGFMLLLSVTAEQAFAWTCTSTSCPDCYRCTETGCERRCSPGVGCCGGRCCSKECCDGVCCDACCEGLKCYNHLTHKCCGEGTGRVCDIDETCCDGDCCDLVTKQCCNDIGGDNDGYCCDKDCEICCEGTCCKNYQCCIDGQCVDPICDNCHTVSETMWECHHWESDPNGTPCSTVECIENVLNSATCDYKGDDWPCKRSNCDTTLADGIPAPGEVIQTIHDSPCTGGTVDWELWYEHYYGCIGCWIGGTLKSCEVFWCEDDPIPGRGGPRGLKKECGCDYECD